MATTRTIVDVKGLTKLLPVTEEQARDLVQKPDNPIPHKKIGRRIWFDMDKVHLWFDAQPGKDYTVPSMPKGRSL